ncbi:MAG: ATP-binding protein [Bacillota bacterium]
MASIAVVAGVAIGFVISFGHETVTKAVLLAVTLTVPGYVAFIVQLRARRKVERRLVDMAQSIPGAVFQLRRHPSGARTYDFVSEHAAAVHHFDREMREDRAAFFETVLEEDQARFVAAMREAEDRLAPLEHDYRVRDSEGAIWWVHTSASVRRRRDGTLVWSGHWSDVTDKKRMERAIVDAKDSAERADRAKTTFLATMSHEIRTPMNGLLGMLELLALSKLEPQQEATVGVARTSAKALLRLIDDILDFSKIESGRIEIRPEPTSLDRIIETTVTIYAGNASSKGLTLRTSLDSRIAPVVRVDPVRLQQILNNFVSNAIKFTERGHVELATHLIEREDDRQVVRFSVSDSGIGMTDEQQARVFDAFSRPETDWQRPTGSTGLGLTICRRLVELMGGEMKVSSAPGRGTRMSITLPLQVLDACLLSHEPETAEAAPEVRLGARRMPPSVEAADAEGTLVLVADDHPINRLLLQRQLAILGYASLLANDGLDALALWKEHRFGLVITDCNMPRMDGFELAKRIRADEAANAKRVRIIACTANAMQEDAARCFESGMDDYLAKPVEIGDLGARLDRWLPLPGGAVHERLPEPPAAASSAQFALLAHYSGGDRELERRLLTEFRKSTEQDRAALDAALASDDPDALARAFHRIKGASRTIGAEGLAQICEELERASRNRNVEAVRSRLTAFCDEVGRVDEQIARY